MTAELVLLSLTRGGGMMRVVSANWHGCKWGYCGMRQCPIPLPKIRRINGGFNTTVWAYFGDLYSL